jgi:hypothetical protein
MPKAHAGALRAFGGRLLAPRSRQKYSNNTIDLNDVHSRLAAPRAETALMELKQLWLMGRCRAAAAVALPWSPC